MSRLRSSPATLTIIAHCWQHFLPNGKPGSNNADGRACRETTSVAKQYWAVLAHVFAPTTNRADDSLSSRADFAQGHVSRSGHQRTWRSPASCVLPPNEPTHKAIPRAGRCDRQYVCIPVRGGTELSGANIGQKGDIPWPKATRYKFIFLTAANRLTRHSVNAG